MNRKGIAKRNKFIIADYESGMRIVDIADKHGYEKSNVCCVLKKAGVWIKGRDGNRKRGMAKPKQSGYYTISGLSIPPYIKALYYSKNIITTECILPTRIYRGVI